ncbi:DUF2515 family protein [Paenibacillus qinlingensis]|uniref:DUF2515 domain-containing protein n=1 Tax=Paenibacillus qinlingensis TaxID=1837343 RepID=A0ABU1P2T9_9BACL|nr:DUF2515 family protein [Paenibacillus qinlingensis]MDR6554056.1 hypothetical protein [Paenibacillus qinlingensis]
MRVQLPPENKKNLSVYAKMRGLPGALAQLVKQQAAKLITSSDAEQTASPPTIEITPTMLARLEKALRHQHALLQAGVIPPAITAYEQEIVARIVAKTQAHNRNNVTRTQAYWTCYRDFPELHWALLAHMVSRNGGWCMTDLRGELLPHLLNNEATEHLFAFLERANALIFQDAYPQLLLYAESKRRKLNLFHLLPHLHISAWMMPIWQDFWLYQDTTLLTLGLIVNEQHYVEDRVVQNPLYKQTVLNTPQFKTQAWLQLNQVGFPFRSASVDLPQPHLAGLILENFKNLSERIEFGKSLYAILFWAPGILQGAIAFAASTPHTGSRSDYWPHLFAQIRKTPPDLKYQERLDGYSLKKGAAPFYSPPLHSAWPDRPLAPVERGDWFTELKEPLQHMQSFAVPESYDLTRDMCLGLSKVELAVVSAQAIKKLMR